MESASQDVGPAVHNIGPAMCIPLIRNKQSTDPIITSTVPND